MGIKIVTSNGQEVQSFEDWRNGRNSSGGGQQASGYSGPKIVNSSGQTVQSFEDWRKQRNQQSAAGNTLQNQWMKKYQGKGYRSLASTIETMEDGEEREPSLTVGKDVTWCSHCVKQ